MLIHKFNLHGKAMQDTSLNDEITKKQKLHHRKATRSENLMVINATCQKYPTSRYMLCQAPSHLAYTQDSLFSPSFSHTQKKSETELVFKGEEERAHFLQKSVVLAVQRRKKGNTLKRWT